MNQLSMSVPGTPCQDHSVIGDRDGTDDAQAHITWVLDFDHLGDKLFGIAQGIRDRSLQALLYEMAKCEVVWANCHRRRTAIRGGFLRAVVAQR
jgi:hypothetical protein